MRQYSRSTTGWRHQGYLWIIGRCFARWQSSISSHDSETVRIIWTQIQGRTDTNRYLFQSKHIIEQREERSLALLCLSYLNFDCFETTISDDLLTKFIKDGSYAFIDYSCLHWSDHLESATKSLTVEDLDYKMPLAKAVDEFFLSNDPGEVPRNKVYEEIAKKCEAFQKSDCYEPIVTLVSNNKAARGASDQMEALGQLGITVIRVRKMLQKLSTASEVSAFEKQILQRYYGKNWYKCPRHACHYFHEGFSSNSNLEQHTNRHDKPCCCTVIGCTRMYIGWPTEKDYKKHMSQTHPDPESLSFKFPHVKKLPTVFQCELCAKNYNRASILKVHVQREHSDQRDFVCGVCPKKFVRKYELDRHEKSTHSTGTPGSSQSFGNSNNDGELLGSTWVSEKLYSTYLLCRWFVCFEHERLVFSPHKRARSTNVSNKSRNVCTAEFSQSRSQLGKCWRSEPTVQLETSWSI